MKRIQSDHSMSGQDQHPFFQEETLTPMQILYVYTLVSVCMPATLHPCVPFT